MEMRRYLSYHMYPKLPILVVISVVASAVLVLITIFSLHVLTLQLLCVFFVLIANTALLVTLMEHPNKPPHQPIPQQDHEPEINTEHQSTSVSDEKMHEAIISNIGQGLVVTDKLGLIIEFNKAAEALLGWTKQEALGKSLHDIINVNYKSSEADTSNFKNQAKLYFVRKDTTTFPAAISSTSYVQGDKILGTITLFRDITTEQNIDSIKNEFISLASHQLRTPLAGIKWYTDMLIKGDAGMLSKEQLEFTNYIYLSTEKMIELVNALLNISRIESGRLSIEPKPTDIKQYIEEILGDVTIRYEGKKQKFELHIPHDLPPINLDQRLVRQIYTNLLTNAAKYTPDNGTIQVIITRQDKDVISEIKDTGYGIPQDEKSRVFDKFYRGANIVQQVTDGTGLGLYLVKAIVELCQGKIWYESEEKKGTSFWFSLPISGTPAKKGAVTLND